MSFLLHRALPLLIAITPSAAALAAPDLAGTWTLVYADVIRPDGTRAHDYGDTPHGRLQIDAQGRYSLQIFDGARPKFATNDKKAGTPDEFKAAVLGASTHYGTISADGKVLSFHIEGASFPNWEGLTQPREYELVDDVLSYRVPPRPDGGVPISGWKRVK